MQYHKIETGCFELTDNQTHKRNGMDNGDFFRKVYSCHYKGFSPERTGIKPTIDDKIK